MRLGEGRLALRAALLTPPDASPISGPRALAAGAVGARRAAKPSTLMTDSRNASFA